MDRALAALNEELPFVAMPRHISCRRYPTFELDSLPFEVHDPKQRTPEEKMSLDQDREFVWSMLARLPATYREPMVLFYRCEESTRAVAFALGEEAKANGEPIRESILRQRDAAGLQAKEATADGSVANEAFRWNVGGWFGSGLGATAWMLPLAFAAIWFGSTSVAILLTACYLSAVAMIVLLWRSRERLAAYTALQILIAWLGFLTSLVLAGLQLLATPKVQHFAQWTPWAWLTLLIFPAIAFKFWWQRNSSRRWQSKGCHQASEADHHEQ